MPPVEAYDVLRLIEHGQTCYVSSENVEGTPLIIWIHQHPDVSKEDLFKWIQDMVRQLAQIHKCRGQPCYQYVNPYSLILTKDGELYFLDMEAATNENQVERMRGRSIREHFLPPDDPYYQHASKELDLYGLGRTLQYMLAQTVVEPGLTRGEEQKFQKLIARCLDIGSRHALSDAGAVLKRLPPYRARAGKKKWPLVILVLILLVAALAVVVFLHFSRGDSPGRERELSAAEEASAAAPADAQQGTMPLPEAAEPDEETASRTESGVPGGTAEELTDLHRELGLVYFLDLEAYGQGQAHFEAMTGEAMAEPLARICACLGETADPSDQDALRRALTDAQAALDESEEEAAGDYRLCILKGYRMLDSAEDDAAVIRLGEACLQDESHRDLNWVKSSMAAAYEREGKNQEAVDLYQDWLAGEIDPAVRTDLYQKTGSLFAEMGQVDQAIQSVQEGILEFPESVDLRLLYVRLLFRKDPVDRAACMEEISTCLAELPALTGEQELDKILKENGMKIEGGKVCEGK